MENIKKYTTKIYELAYYFMDRAREFELEDFIAMKICLISLGVMIGAAFSGFFKKASFLVKIIFAVSYIYLICKILFPCKED